MVNQEVRILFSVMVVATTIGLLACVTTIIGTLFGWAVVDASMVICLWTVVAVLIGLAAMLGVSLVD